MPRTSPGNHPARYVAVFIVAVALLTASATNPAAAAAPSAAPPTATPPASPSPAASPSPSASQSPVPTATARPTARFTTAPTPTLSGSAVFGQTLTAAPGAWKPAPALTYQWRIDGVAATGATARTWKLPAAAVGKKVSVTVTARKTGYTTTQKTSAPTRTVTAATMVVGTIAMTGSASVGKKLTPVLRGWGPAPVTFGYQWLRDGVAISKATSSSYVPVQADRGRMVSLRVTVRKPGYGSKTVTSKAYRVGLPLTSTPVPTVSGTVAVGKTLTARAGAWGPSPVALSYSWLRDGKVIAKATTSTYKLGAADAGKRISVRVTAAKSGYTSASRVSAAVAVPRVLTVPAKVTISGDASVGATLTAAAGTWGPGTVARSYQWLRNGAAIPGATARTYRVVSADAAKGISVRITGRKSGYTTVSRTSAAVTPLFVFTTSPVPTVSGTARSGNVLSASLGAWKPSGATLKVQWRVDGGAVPGATAATWEIPAWAAGRSVTVTVTATKKDHRTTSRTSVARQISWSLGDDITPGTALRSGVTLTSPSGAYTFGLRGDGNVALARGVTMLRSAKTTGTLDGTLQLTGDGELVLLDDADAVVWSSRTAGLEARALSLGDDGVLRLVDGQGDDLWTSARMPVFSDPAAASATIPGRYGWAYPIRPKGSFTTYSGHSGDDIAAPTGTPVYAMRGGTVSVREIWITSGCPSWAPNRTKQKEVVITSTIDGTRFVQVYAHLSAFSVKTGQTVKAGQRIGSVGSTGCSTGPHLHTAFTVDGERYALYPRDVLGTASY